MFKKITTLSIVALVMQMIFSIYLIDGASAKLDEAYQKELIVKTQSEKEAILGFKNEVEINTIEKILILTIITSLILLAIYRQLFIEAERELEEIDNVIIKNLNGDLSHKIEIEPSLHPKFNSIATNYNTLLSLLNNMKTSVSKILHTNDHNLKEATSKVKLLADINAFKHVVEHDRNIAQVYSRIVQIVKKLTGNSVFVIQKITDDDMQIIYSGLNDDTVCNPITVTESNNCRAFRTSSLVSSFEFEQPCKFYCANCKHYICLPFRINENYHLVISLLSNNRDDELKLKKTTKIIEFYLENIRPTLEKHFLMMKLIEKSLHDGLTGVYNRKFLEDLAEKISYQAEREPIGYSVLMLDIDNFKSINDTYGHHIGDDFIRLLANTMREIVRKADIVCRYGGEEFVILLYNCNIENAKEVAEKIRESFKSKTVFIDKKRVSRTVSIGVAYFPKDNKTADLKHTIKEADKALYFAKENGKDRVVVIEQTKE